MKFIKYICKKYKGDLFGRMVHSPQRYFLNQSCAVLPVYESCYDEYSQTFIRNCFALY